MEILTDRKSRPSLWKGLWIQDRKYNLRVFYVLAAAEILMAFSPFGFIIFSHISMTTLFICVMVSALWGGPLAGGGIGMIFGLCSMWKASVTGVNANDLIFSPVYSGDPLGSIVLALAPRMLFGVIAGILYYAILAFAPRKARLPLILLISAALERVHSMLVYLFMDKVFHVEGASAWNSLRRLFSTKRLVEYGIVIVIMFIVCIIYEKLLSRRYYGEFREIQKQGFAWPLKYAVLALSTVTVLFFTALHFWDREKIVLYQIDLLAPGQLSSDRLLQVLLQFMAAAIAAMYIVIVLYRHARSMEEIGRGKMLLQLEREKERSREMEERALQDALTGVYNRKGLEKVIADDGLEHTALGYLLLDIDRFKEINDTCGHDIGDMVLRNTAGWLQEAFGMNRVFRLGGDEFAVLICGNVQDRWEEICGKLEEIHRRAEKELPEATSVSLSAGLVYSPEGYEEKLYPLADDALYETKRSGRAGCTLADGDGNILKRWKDKKHEEEIINADF